MMNSITTTTARIATRGNNSNSSRNSCRIAVKALFSTTSTSTSRTSTSTSSSSPLATRQQQKFCQHHPSHPFILRRNYCSLSSSFSASYSGAITTASSLSPPIRMMISMRSFSATTSGGSSGGSSSNKKETGSKDVSDSDSDTDNEQAKEKEEPTTTPSAATLPVPLPAVPEGAHLVAEEVDDTMNSPTSTSTTSSISTYDPYEIVKSFEDTSYYYPPSEEMETDYLAAKYQTFTNQDLLDSSTIVPIMDSDRPSTTTNTNNNNSNNTWKTLIHSPPTRDLNLPKGTLVGTVVSTKMEKTVNVAINRYRIHPKYSKRMKYTRKFMAHDEKEVASLGDTVMIVPCQRISKMKHFMLREIVTAKGQL